VKKPLLFRKSETTLEKNQESGEVLESEPSSVPPICLGNENHWQNSGTQIVGISEKAFAFLQIRDVPLGKFRFPHWTGNSEKAILLSGNQSTPRPLSVPKNWRTFGGSEKAVFALWKSGPPSGRKNRRTIGGSEKALFAFWKSEIAPPLWGKTVE